jgi:flagellar motor switch protein FliN
MKNKEEELKFNNLLDVKLGVTVELGKSTKTLEEVLSLGEGSIIELDKLAGEPIDLLVNGKPIAKGEVVVIDENFGVRITKILDNNKIVTEDTDV